MTATQTRQSSDTMPAHTFNGWAKVPSRRGGLKSAKCTCGWKGPAQGAAEGLSHFTQHATEAAQA